VKNGDKFETRHVGISSTNDKVIALEESGFDEVRAGELVVLDPRQHIEKFDFSRFPVFREDDNAEAVTNMPPANGKAALGDATSRTGEPESPTAIDEATVPAKTSVDASRKAAT
jgi:hypothetical protein